MSSPRIAIVGAGIAGLACARALVDGGLAPVILDKGRGVGGRLATRRVDGSLQFDHGAPHIAAMSPGFGAVLQEAVAAGALARLHPDAKTAEAGPDYVGIPGMSGFPRHLARDLDIRTGLRVSAVTKDDAGWRVTAGDWSETFDRVILTLPAPQVPHLLGPTNPFSGTLSAVQMSSCLTLMAAFAGPEKPVGRGSATSAFELVTLESAKPGRPKEPQCWVAHACDDFSRRHLERDLPEIADLMLPMLCDHLGRRPSEAVHAVAHRWRFARVKYPLERPFLADCQSQLHLGGDWCLGQMAEDAWTSGRAIADDILSR
jgi:predicted NAD/FAD-dependent oxidoreductase